VRCTGLERTRAEGERLLILAHQAGDRMREGAALASMGWASTWGHDFERGLAYTRQAIDIATQVDAKQVLASGHSREETHKALMVSQSVGDVNHQSLALSSTGMLKNWEGEYVQAAQFQSEGLRIAREHNLLVPLLRGLFGYGVTLTGQGEYDGARAVLEEGLALSEKVGDKFWSHRLLNSLGWLYMEVGDFDRALDFNQRGAEGARQRGDPETTANAELNLGDIFLARGELTLAQDILNEVYRLTHDPATSDWMRWRYSMHLFVNLGELWLARGDLAKAQEFTDRCLDIAVRTHSRKYEVRGKRLRGEIAVAQRQWEAAEVWLRQALLLARAVGNPPQLWKTYVAIGHLFREMKQPTRAQEFYQGARDVIYRTKVTLRNSELRTSLEQSPLTQAIYELSMSG
jgi:tetratricopeptide (TPR) repeat protein